MFTRSWTEFSWRIREILLINSLINKFIAYLGELDIMYVGQLRDTPGGRGTD